MRKRYRVLLFSALVAALTVPVGFALSLEPSPAASAIVPASVVATTVRTSSEVPDALRLMLAGTALFGLAALMRRAA